MLECLCSIVFFVIVSLTLVIIYHALTPEAMLNQYHHLTSLIQKFSFIASADHITSNFLKAVFHEILLGPFLNTLSHINQRKLINHIITEIITFQVNLRECAKAV